MNLTQYNQFTEELRLKLAGDDRVLALVAVGSMAQQDYQPDEWSDHDFLLSPFTACRKICGATCPGCPGPTSWSFRFAKRNTA